MTNYFINFSTTPEHPAGEKIFKAIDKGNGISFKKA